MDLLKEIRDKLAAVGPSHMWKIDGLPEYAPGYVFREGIWYGVAFPYYGKKVAENFASARLCTKSMLLQDITVPMLAIECSDNKLRYQFATLCESFLNPGETGVKRKIIDENPFSWWKEWCELLGNTMHNKAPFEVLGELLSFEYLYKHGLNPIWAGPTGSTQDIQSDSCNYEVKSTTERYTTAITISSKFQLVPGDKPLKLLFARFEKDNGGDSLEKAVKRMALSGYDEDELLALLKLENFEPGNLAYSEGYRLLELREYKIDENFPLLTDASFIGGHLPENITRFTYTVNLAGLPYVNLKEIG